MPPNKHKKPPFWGAFFVCRLRAIRYECGKGGGDYRQAAGKERGDDSVSVADAVGNMGFIDSAKSTDRLAVCRVAA